MYLVGGMLRHLRTATLGETFLFFFVRTIKGSLLLSTDWPDLT